MINSGVRRRSELIDDQGQKTLGQGEQARCWRWRAIARGYLFMAVAEMIRGSRVWATHTASVCIWPVTWSVNSPQQHFRLNCRIEHSSRYRKRSRMTNFDSFWWRGRFEIRLLVRGFIWCGVGRWTFCSPLNPAHWRAFSELDPHPPTCGPTFHPFSPPLSFSGTPNNHSSKCICTTKAFALICLSWT